MFETLEALLARAVPPADLPERGEEPVTRGANAEWDGICVLQSHEP